MSEREIALLGLALLLDSERRPFSEDTLHIAKGELVPLPFFITFPYKGTQIELPIYKITPDEKWFGGWNISFVTCEKFVIKTSKENMTFITSDDAALERVIDSSICWLNEPEQSKIHLIKDTVEKRSAWRAWWLSPKF
jgi:hypothetical protein